MSIEENKTKDLLNRESLIKNLTTIIENLDLTEGKVIGIDSKYGTGKTTFLNLWYEKLKKNPNYTCTLFNSWENDDSNEPLISFLSDFPEELKKNENWKTAVNYSNILVNKMPKLLIKTLMNFLKIDKENQNEILAVFDNLVADGLNSDNIKDLLETKEGKWSKSLKNLTAYDEEILRKKVKEQFKEKIKKILKEENKKLIVFVDELGRCRPTYAIELLEVIKHLFNVENCIFIIAWDKTQLSHSIKTVYGSEMNSEGYLRRFIDLDYSLPEPNNREYFEILLEKNGLEKNKNSYFFKTMNFLVELPELDFSLRDIDKLVFYLKIFFKRNNFINIKYEDAIINIGKMDEYIGELCQEFLEAICIILYFKKRELYLKIKNKAVYYKVSQDLKTLNLKTLNMTEQIILDKICYSTLFEEKVSIAFSLKESPMKQSLAESLNKIYKDIFPQFINGENEFIIKSSVQLDGLYVKKSGEYTIRLISIYGETSIYNRIEFLDNVINDLM